MINASRFPLYAKIAFIFIGLFCTVYTLYVARDILIPIAYSLIIATLLSPLVMRLERRKINRIASISIAVVLAILLTAGLIYFILSQLSMFNNALPMMRQKVSLLQGETAK